MKYATIIKTGYSVGLYGNSGEYFTCVFTSKNGMSYFKFEGQYGGEERVEQLLKDRGYKIAHVNADYGKVLKKDICHSHSEWTVEKNIDELLKHGDIE